MRNLWRAFAYTRKYWARGLLMLFGSMLFSASVALMAYLAGDLFKTILADASKLTESDRQARFEDVIALCKIFAALAVVRGVCGFLRAYFNKWLSNRTARDAQNQVMAHLLTLPVFYFDGKRSGELLARMTHDAYSLRKTVQLAINMVQAPMTLISLAAVLFFKKWDLALLGFVGFPLAILPMVILSRKMRKASKNSRKRVADLTSLMVQLFSGVRLVRAYGQEQTENERFVSTNEKIFRHQIKGARAKALGRPVVEILASLGVVAVMLAGAYMVLIMGTLDPSVIATFVIALMAMYGPAKALTKANEEIQHTVPGVDRLFALLDVSNEMADAEDASTLDEITVGIDIHNVSFEYVPDTPVLREINLSVEKGQTVALVGPSGAGKSTLLDLVCRFYDPQEGSISVDGHDLREVQSSSLLSQIAIVPQEPFLFNDTVKANILYGKPGANDEEVYAAARAAAVHDELLELDDGYDTIVGERGTRLSGGQRQRVSIARALLRNAPILILDEATSSLDSQSERLVQQAVERLLEGRTTLVIAHRLSTIRHADRIVVLVNGRVEETGAHDELLESSATYSRLWEMQQAGPPPAPERE